jgi:hypothetical protein
MAKHSSATPIIRCPKKGPEGLGRGGPRPTGRSLWAAKMFAWLPQHPAPGDAAGEVSLRYSAISPTRRSVVSQMRRREDSTNSARSTSGACTMADRLEVVALDERLMPLLRPALSHANRETGRSGDLSRPGRLLAVGAGPRGQTAIAVGQAAPDAKSFMLEAVRGSLTNGIVSNPFFEQAFRTDATRSRSTSTPMARGRTNKTRC